MNLGVTGFHLTYPCIYFQSIRQHTLTNKREVNSRGAEEQLQFCHDVIILGQRRSV